MVNPALAGTVKSAATCLSSYSVAAQVILAVSAVAGINQIIEVASFKCPCVMEVDLNLTCKSHGNFCPTANKAIYSYLFIFGPAAILFILSFMVNKIFLRKITGCCPAKDESLCFSFVEDKGENAAHKKQNNSGNQDREPLNGQMQKKKSNKKIKSFFFSSVVNPFSSSCIFRILCFAFIAPFSWIILSLIDGEYLACALTSLPYSFRPGQACQNTTNVSTEGYQTTRFCIVYLKRI